MAKIGIGQISKIVDLPTKTIRFYEQESLLRKVSREENGYRFYTTQNIEELKVIKHARSLGFTLLQIKNLLHNPDNLGDYLQSIIEQNEAELTRLKLTNKNLISLQRELQHSKSTCTGDEYCCNIFYQTLKHKKKGGEQTKWSTKTAAVASVNAKLVPANK